MIELNLIQNIIVNISDKTVLQQHFISKLTNENENCIYFPHFMIGEVDFILNRISFQGGELARSLIFLR